MSKAAISNQLNAIHDAFNRGDNDALKACYTNDAHIVPKPLAGPGHCASIVDNVNEFRKKYAREYIVSHGAEVVLEAGDVALVMTNLYLAEKKSDVLPCEPVKAVYVFQKGGNGIWQCAVDNFFGVDLLTYS